MNTLTVNLHLMMVSFYRPTAERGTASSYEGQRLPLGPYAVAIQVALPRLRPGRGAGAARRRGRARTLLRPEDMLEAIARQGERLALVLLGDVNYLTGQAFDMARHHPRGPRSRRHRGLRPRPRRRKPRLPAPRRRAGLRGVVLVQVPQRRTRDARRRLRARAARARAAGFPASRAGGATTRPPGSRWGRGFEANGRARRVGSSPIRPSSPAGRAAGLDGPLRCGGDDRAAPEVRAADRL